MKILQLSAFVGVLLLVGCSDPEAAAQAERDATAAAIRNERPIDLKPVTGTDDAAEAQAERDATAQKIASEKPIQLTPVKRADAGATDEDPHK